MPDSSRQEGAINHYFAYPIEYQGEKCYVFCWAIQDANTNRLYVHEVFVEDKIKKGNIVVLFPGFQKKSQKTPASQIDLAKKLMNEYFNDKENG